MQYEVVNMLATLVYGVLSLIALLVAATVHGGLLAVTLAVVAAGLTYVFQALQLASPDRTALLYSVWALVIVAWAGSLTATIFGV